MEHTVEIDWHKIEKIIEKYNSNREALLMIMQDISDIYNYVPPEVIPLLVDKIGVDEGLIYSVATFYKAISLEPRGKYIINVCTGTACHVRGAARILEEADRSTGTGEVGALLRREGLYSSHLTQWRKQRERGMLNGLTPKKRGRKAKRKDPLLKENQRLQREVEELRRRLKQAETIIDFQKKISEILGIPLESSEKSETEE